MKVQYFYIHGIRFPGSLKLVGLRFRLSFFSGSHHVPWQRNYTMCSWPHSQQWNWVTHATTTQNMNTPVQTCPSTQSSHLQATSTFLHDISLRFVSNSSFWMPFRTLLAIIIEKHMKTLNNFKRLTTRKQVWQASASTQDTTQASQWFQNLPFQDNSIPSCPIRHSPLLNSQSPQIALCAAVRHAVPREEWTSSRSECPTEDSNRLFSLPSGSILILEVRHPSHG